MPTATSARWRWASLPLPAVLWAEPIVEAGGSSPFDSCQGIRQVLLANQSGEIRPPAQKKGLSEGGRAGAVWGRTLRLCWGASPEPQENPLPSHLFLTPNAVQRCQSPALRRRKFAIRGFRNRKSTCAPAGCNLDHFPRNDLANRVAAIHKVQLAKGTIEGKLDNVTLIWRKLPVLKESRDGHRRFRIVLAGGSATGLSATDLPCAQRWYGSIHESEMGQRIIFCKVLTFHPS